MSPTEKLNKPAVVICHGSYHTPAPYGPFIRSLNSHEFETVHCPQRPTCDLSRLNVGDDLLNPDFDLGPPAEGYPSDTEDANVVIQVLDKLVNKDGKDVLLLAHSSGGWVASQAAIPEYQLKARQSRGEKGGIIGIFYSGALVVPVGESVTSFFQPKDGTLVTPPYMRFHASVALIFLIKKSIDLQVVYRNTATTVSEHPSTPPTTCSTGLHPKKQSNGQKR
jgi:hypothetical protein